MRRVDTTMRSSSCPLALPSPCTGAAIALTLALALTACALPLPESKPAAIDPGLFPHDHARIFSAYLSASLHDPGAAQVLLVSQPLRYTRAAAPPNPAFDGWASCYSVDASQSKGAPLGARVHLALFQGGGLYDVLVDEPRAALSVRAEVRRNCQAEPPPAPLVASRAAPGRAPIAVGADGRPAIPGVLNLPPAPPPAPAAAPTGQFTYAAEQVARHLKCEPAPRAVLVGKGPGFETYALRCSDGRSLTLRCDFGHCNNPVR